MLYAKPILTLEKMVTPKIKIVSTKKSLRPDSSFALDQKSFSFFFYFMKSPDAKSIESFLYSMSFVGGT